MILMRLSENSTKTLYNTKTRNHAKNEDEVFKEYFLFLQNESRKNYLFFLAGKMTLESCIPFAHSVDLVLVVSLTRAC